MTIGMIILTLILLHSAFVSSKSATKPQILEHPQNILSRTNDPATLKCTVNGTSDVSWYQNDSPVVLGASRMILNDWSLFFLNLQHSDEGHYFCVARNTAGVSKSRVAVVKLSRIGKDFLSLDRTIKTAEGKQAELSCNPPTGYPEPSIYWLHNNIPVTLGNGTFMKGNNLVISKSVTEDSGAYVCVATNVADTVKSPPVELFVINKPQINGNNGVLIAEAGSFVDFFCSPTKYQKEGLSWTKNNDALPKSRSQLSSNGEVLTIMRLVPSDSGVYVCKATNAAGSTSLEYTLRVSQTPTIINRPTDMVRLHQQPFKLKIDMEEPHISVWKISSGANQRLVLPGQTFDRGSTSNDVFKINNASINDTGRYSFWAITPHGSVCVPTSVNILENYPPPMIGEAPKDQIAPKGSSVIIPCSVVSEFQDHKSTWWLQSLLGDSMEEVFEASNYKYLRNGALQINNFDVYMQGVYTCEVVANSYLVTASARITMETVPKKTVQTNMSKKLPHSPTKPIAFAVNSSTINLAWKQHSKTRNLHEKYDIYYWFSSLNSWRVVATHVSGNSCQIGNLDANTDYIFSVRAINSAGESYPSPWSDIIRTTTLPLHHVNLPRMFLEDVKQSGDLVTLKWTPIDPMDYNVVNIYRIFNHSIEKTIVSGSPSSYEIGELAPGTYDFFITKSKGFTESTPSNSINFAVKANEVACEVPEISVASDQITLKWVTDGIARKVIVNHDGFLTRQYESYHSSFTIGNLVPDKRYELFVYCKSQMDFSHKYIIQTWPETSNGTEHSSIDYSMMGIVITITVCIFLFIIVCLYFVFKLTRKAKEPQSEKAQPNLYEPVESGLPLYENPHFVRMVSYDNPYYPRCSTKSSFDNPYAPISSFQKMSAGIRTSMQSKTQYTKEICIEEPSSVCTIIDCSEPVEKGDESNSLR